MMTSMRHHHLHHLLTSFTPVDDAEATHRHRMLDLVRHHDCFERTHFQPGHFTASAFVLSPDRSSLLLILHTKLHRWLQPGGHVEPGDADALAAARRELAEEAGLTDLTLAHPGVFDLDIHPIPALRGEPAHEHFDVRFLFTAHHENCTAGSDAKSFRWTPLHQITVQLTDASVMRAVSKLRTS